MDWAGREGLDTAALKRAKVPIFGKWYFPDLPANEPLVNLSTGEIETFPAGYRAGAVLYVKEADLKQAGLGPYKSAPLRRLPLHRHQQCRLRNRSRSRRPRPLRGRLAPPRSWRRACRTRRRPAHAGGRVKGQRTVAPC